MKTEAPQQVPRRKNEDEEEREDSTSCETNSDDDVHSSAHYRQDFFLSPMMHAQKPPSFGEFRLDSDQSNIFSTTTTDEEFTTNKRKQSSVCEEETECNSHSNKDGQCPTKLKFKCKFNHQQPSSQDSIKMKWCSKCDDLLKKCKAFAEENGGECTNEVYEEQVHFRCEKGHTWKLNHKNARKRWCLDCVKLQKAELKKKCEQERAQR